MLDTNVLLYAVSNDPKETSKTKLARALLQKPGLALSVQVIQEFYVQATRASGLNLSHADAMEFLHLFHRHPVQPMTRELVFQALVLKARYQISYWDAAIISAAKALGCTTVYSEDLNHGQDYDGVGIINPFL
jgi:predicted nucleic acid-binding protein